MGDRYQARRGMTAQRLLKIMEAGELGYDVVTKQLYVGDGATPGGVLVGPAILYALDRTNTPPGSPSDSDAYIVTATASGLWTGQENKLAFWSGGQWNFLSPPNGTQALVADEDIIYIWDGTNWETLAQKLFGANSNVRVAADGNWQMRDTVDSNWKDVWLEDGQHTAQDTGES